MKSSTLFVNVMLLRVSQFVLVCALAESGVTLINSDEDQDGLYIPEQMTFDETALFWETLVCNTKNEKLNVCDKVYISKHNYTCSPFSCKGCECSRCASSRDCCVDKYLNVTNTTPYRYMTCRVPSPQNVAKERNETSYYFVDKCPESFLNPGIKGKCENILPISSKEEANRNMAVYSKMSKVNYLNQFCAQCHLDDKQLAFWKTEMRCYDIVDVSESQSERELFSQLANNPNCVILGGSPPESVQACGHIEVINVCNVTGEWLSYDGELNMLCAMYENRVSINEDIYRNIFCAFCNGISRTWVQEMFNEPFTCNSPIMVREWIQPTFSVLFKFTTSSEVGGETPKTRLIKECPGGMVFHPVKKVCETLVCSKGRYINNHSCVDAYKTSYTIGYRITLYLLPTIDGLGKQCSFPHNLHELLLNSLYTHRLFERFDLLYSAVSMVICTRNSDVTVLPSDGVIEVDFQIIVGEDKPPEEVESNLLKLYNTTVTVSGLDWTILNQRPQSNAFNVNEDKGPSKTLNATKSQEKVDKNRKEKCNQLPHPETLNVDKGKMPRKDSNAKTTQGGFNEQTEKFNVNKEKVYCKTLNATNTKENVEVPLKYKDNPNAFITVNKFTRCNQIQLQTDDYTIIDKTKRTLKLGWSEEVLNRQDYYFVNDTPRICVNYSGWYEADDKIRPEDGVEATITIVCVSLSLVALSLTFIICLCVKANETLPGLITIILITLIFISQLVFLFYGYALDKPWACRAVGLALHFFWLSVFAWKNVAAYHMYSIFTKPFEHTHKTHGKYLLRYSLYGFGLPAIIVGSYVGIHSVLSSSASIGYGSVGACFLSREIDVGLAFALPVGLVLVSNLYLFGRAVHVIRQTSGIGKHSNKVNANHNALFVKMSIILGFTWIVGFIANIISKPFIWYIFAVLNGGIGVLIFASQVRNRIVDRHCCKTLDDFSTEDSTKTSNSDKGNVGKASY